MASTLFSLSFFFSLFYSPQQLLLSLHVVPAPRVLKDAVPSMATVATGLIFVLRPIALVLAMLNLNAIQADGVQNIQNQVYVL